MTTTENPLGWVDFIVMSVMLVAAAGMGIYHGVARGGQKTTKRFFLADRNVYGLAIAMTLLASFISPVTLLGIPAEIYTYGGQYLAFTLTQSLLFPTIAMVFVPVFHGLDITTAYEYLQLRYGLPLRILGACLFILQTCFYMAIVTYTPALAIEAVTAFDLWKTILITGVVCTFYTTLGGMKAVIWTDVMMFFVIFITCILVIVMGTAEAGGISHVWETNKEAGRLNLFESVWLNLPFSTALVAIACVEGLVLYAFYNEPSELTPTEAVYSREIAPSNVTYPTTHGKTPPSPPDLDKSDQILMFFVSEQFGHIPGYQGLFISCLFAGALSTVSSGLNAIVAVILVDIYKPLKKLIAERRHKQFVENDAHNTLIAKVLTFVFGAFTIVLSFTASKLGTLITIANSMFGALGGPLVATFLLGMFWKRANTWGVLIATLISFALGAWMSAGSFLNREAFILYQISFNWYATLTISTTVLIAVPLSELFRYLIPAEQSKKVDPKLLATFVRPKMTDNEVRTSNVFIDSKKKKKSLESTEQELEEHELNSCVSKEHQ
ncbi:putative sodium-dependent multivitamin transporter-like [Apostichopus japonicus]|uniref:Putative sodium-dependent multivitamin transporter-like n=1 Tax=Stichopus japonicus TaxID=307972 RepID=A0A2G8LES1_STIJA|nr:putative sodium-dependent multivitamin transporter-like [Apostichopus japonicus]